MVKQTRHIFEISDILAFKLRCNTCKGEMASSLGDLVRIVVCPLCGVTWDISGEPSPTRETLRALRELARQSDPSRTIRFEIDGDEAS